MNPEPTETEIASLGEFGLIERLTEAFTNGRASTRMGVGDDAAVLQQDGLLQLVSTDMFSEGVHFDFTYTPLQHLGYKAVVASISDVLAMNGLPEQVLVSMALNRRFTVEMVETLYAGIRSACDNYRLDLAGGDVTTTRGGLVLAMTALGTAPEGQVAYRSGLQEHHLLCVTGDLGGAYMGLQLLEREKKVFQQNPEVQPDLSGYPYLLQRHLRPEVRLDVVEHFSQENIRPTAMIDISDGLSSELLHLARRSEVGLQVYEEKIPIADETREAARRFHLDPTLCAMHGGEDYELLFGLPAEMHQLVEHNPDISIIGHVTPKEQGCRLITRSGQQHTITAQGWESFGSTPAS
jgi:thiamine-monophosphate kinase